MAQPLGQIQERAARPVATTDECPAVSSIGTGFQADRLDKARQRVGSCAGVKPGGNIYPPPVAASAGYEQLPKAFTCQGPALIPIIWHVGIDEDELTQAVVEPVGNAGNDHAAVAVPAHRHRSFGDIVNNLGHLVDVIVKIRRTVDIGGAVQFQPRQSHSMHLVPFSSQLGSHRIEHPSPCQPPGTITNLTAAC